VALVGIGLHLDRQMIASDSV